MGSEGSGGKRRTKIEIKLASSDFSPSLYFFVILYIIFNHFLYKELNSFSNSCITQPLIADFKSCILILHSHSSDSLKNEQNLERVNITFVIFYRRLDGPLASKVRSLHDRSCDISSACVLKCALIPITHEQMHKI